MFPDKGSLICLPGKSMIFYKKKTERIELVARPDPLNSSDDSGGLGGGDDDDEIMAEDGLGDSTQLHSETIKINNIAGGGRNISLTREA